MADRALIPLTNEHFAAFCRSMLGQPYWYGTVIYKCTESLRNRKAKQYPSHYGSSRTKRYQQDIKDKKVCSDCIGGLKGYLWTFGGRGVVEAIGTTKTFTSKYGNLCPDKSANGMFSYAKSKGLAWGTIGTMPEIIGLAVRYDGHVGYYMGDGKVIEWRGFAYGCVETELKKRKWLHWYQAPGIDYGKAFDAEMPKEIVLGSRLLQFGMRGDDVKVLQELLMQLGYELPEYGADGDFGKETEDAVLTFQIEHDLQQDGKYGDKTHATLMEAISDAAEPEDEGEAEPEPIRKVRVTGGRVNVRSGPGTQHKILSITTRGTVLEYSAKAENGWYSVTVNGETGWISGKYTEEVVE